MTLYERGTVSENFIKRHRDYLLWTEKLRNLNETSLTPVAENDRSCEVNALRKFRSRFGIEHNPPVENRRDFESDSQRNLELQQGPPDIESYVFWEDYPCGSFEELRARVVFEALRSWEALRSDVPWRVHFERSNESNVWFENLIRETLINKARDLLISTNWNGTEKILGWRSHRLSNFQIFRLISIHQKGALVPPHIQDRGFCWKTTPM